MGYVCIAGNLITKPFKTFEEAKKHKENWLGKFSIFPKIRIEKFVAFEQERE